ncbi:MAG: Tad domain-containing protein [Chloroflexi bacterium]|nr:Tad domain-containing protein [Chloroflexota bacterium]
MFSRRRFRTDRRRQRGQALVLVTLMIVVLLGFAGLTLDSGVAYWNRRMLQNAVDGAALAGARALPKYPDVAIATAYDYAGQNGVPSAEIESVEVFKLFNDDDAIRVRARRQVPNSLMRLLGAGPTTDVPAVAVAVRAALQAGDLVPWGIPADSPKEGPVPLKVGVPQETKGNFQALDFLGGSGAKSYGEWIKYGYNGDVPDPVDADNPWGVDSETGNIVGKTEEGINFLISQDPDGTCTIDIDCPRVVIVPLLEEGWDEAKGKTEVKVVGFAAFFIDKMEVDGGMGTLTVFGHFIDYVYGVGKPAYGNPLDYSGVAGEFLWQ